QITFCPASGYLCRLRLSVPGLRLSVPGLRLPVPGLWLPVPASGFSPARQASPSGREPTRPAGTLAHRAGNSRLSGTSSRLDLTAGAAPGAGGDTRGKAGEELAAGNV